MKKSLFDYVIYLFIVAIIIILGYMVVNKPTNKEELIEELIVNNTSLSLKVGEEKKIDAYVQNNNQAHISYQSADLNIAIVDENGLVKGIGDGQTFIILSYENKDMNIITKRVDVTVINDVMVNSVSFEKDNLIISKGNDFKLTYLLEPENAHLVNVKYLSSNNNIVEIDNEGNVKALNIGIATIRMIVNNNLYADLNVYVLEKQLTTEFVDMPTSIIAEDKITLQIGEEKALNYSVLPNNNLDLIEILNSNNQIISINNNIVKGLKDGISMITIKGVNGIQKVITVEVKKKEINVTGINLTSQNSITLYTDKSPQTSQISYSITPIDATNKEVSYTGYDSNLISVSDDGLIKALKRGTTQIIVKTKDGNKEAKIDVIVKSQYYEDWQGVGQSCNSSDPRDSEFVKCFIDSRQLGVSQTTVTIKAGSSASVRVTLPSSCGTNQGYTRKVADGQTGWSQYVEQYRTNETLTGFTWVITAKPNTSGKTVLVSQTIQYDSLAPSGTCVGNVKSMRTITVKIT